MTDGCAGGMFSFQRHRSIVARIIEQDAVLQTRYTVWISCCVSDAEPALTPGTNMKQSKSSPNPLNPQQFPLHAQKDATAGRDKVREAVPVHAPRQSKRPIERTGKGQTGP